MPDQFYNAMFMYIIFCFGLFVASIYMIRSIFAIPRIIQLHRAQVRLLQEIAKAQGVGEKTVSGIMIENQLIEVQGWVPTQPAAPTNTNS